MTRKNRPCVRLENFTRTVQRCPLEGAFYPMNYSITENEICQDEKLVKEIETKFTSKRLASEVLAQAYERIGYGSKAQRVSDCGTLLEFKKPVGEASAPPSANGCAEAGGASDGWKLTTANFCRDRLCPMCSWRRTYKVYSQISRIMDVIQNDYVFLFLTLTVPNCIADELSQTIDDLQNGFKKFMKYKRVKNAVQGYFKVLEITRNTVYNTYHPHFHNILAVKKSYLTSRDYIQRSEWLELWQRAMCDPTITQVDIRRCKDKQDIREGEKVVKSLGSAVAEVAKYSVKAADFLGRFNKDGFLVAPFPDNEIDEAVITLGSALHGRRLTALGGVFDEVAKKLQLDDCENGDLIHIDGSEMRSDVAFMIRRYSWGCGAYKLIDERREVNVDIEVEK